MKTYIYTLSHPITKEVRYVGKTVNPKQRKHNHSNKARDGGTHKRNWINSLKQQNLRPVFEIIDECDDDWKFWEKHWIATIKGWGHRLCNHTEGGDGLSTANSTSFKKGFEPWNKGTANEDVCIICNKFYKIPISVVEKRKTCSIKCWQQYRKDNNIPSSTTFNKGTIPWNKGVSGYASGKAKYVYQYDMYTGKFIDEWSSAKVAGKSLNINNKGIGQNCINKAKSAGGYFWSYTKQQIINTKSNLTIIEDE